MERPTTFPNPQPPTAPNSRRRLSPYLPQTAPPDRNVDLKLYGVGVGTVADLESNLCDSEEQDGCRSYERAEVLIADPANPGSQVRAGVGAGGRAGGCVGGSWVGGRVWPRICWVGGRVRPRICWVGGRVRPCRDVRWQVAQRLDCTGSGNVRRTACPGSMSAASRALSK